MAAWLSKPSGGTISKPWEFLVSDVRLFPTVDRQGHPGFCELDNLSVSCLQDEVKYRLYPAIDMTPNNISAQKGSELFRKYTW